MMKGFKQETGVPKGMPRKMARVEKAAHKKGF